MSSLFNYAQTIRVRDEDYTTFAATGLPYIIISRSNRPGAYPCRSRQGCFLRSRGAAVVREFRTRQTRLRSRIVLNGNNPASVKKAATAATPAAASPASSPQAAGSQSDGQMAEESDPQIGPAVRRLRQGMILEYRYHIYNAQLNSATNRPQCKRNGLFRDGRQVFTAVSII